MTSSQKDKTDVRCHGWRRLRRLKLREGSANERRRGVAAAELAMVILVFLTIIFGMIELAIVVFQYHVVSQGSRQIARLAIVRGELAPPELTAWGPTTKTVTANSADEVALAGKGYLTGLDLSATTIQLEWLDSSIALEKRVQVTVTTTHQAILSFPLSGSWTLTGRSTMPIAH